MAGKNGEMAGDLSKKIIGTMLRSLTFTHWSHSATEGFEKVIHLVL
jgi:hypothetical protein